MIKKEEGFILRVTPFMETDVVLSIFTKNHGSKSFFIKGGLSNRSKKKPILKEGNWVEFVFYDKPSRSLQKITDIHLVKFFLQLSSHPIKNCLFLCMIEIFREVVREEEVPDEELYQLVSEYIMDLEITDNPFERWLDFHEELLMRIGYGREIRDSYSTYSYSENHHTFIQNAYKNYHEFSKNIDNFKIPKSFEVLKQLLNK